MPKKSKNQMTEKKLAASFSRWLKGQRERAGLSYRQLAAKTPFPSSTLHAWEEGGRIPNLWSFVALCRALGRNPGFALNQILDSKR
ncbi:MAG: helix-turn-helix domain-containing protein [Proteobacteria bacterium]|nr:helix-turn-helix domain-containing protein [Pseudomonadota bacterium]